LGKELALKVGFERSTSIEEKKKEDNLNRIMKDIFNFKKKVFNKIFFM